MKILVAKFILEANTHVPMQCDMEHVAITYGKDALKHMQLNDVFAQDGIEIIPTICADAGCSGVMRKTCFEYIEQRIIQGIYTHMKDLDGIYLHLHGASEIEGIGSGDHHIVKRIRAIVGPYLPIAVVCDPHGNLCKEYVENTTIIRSYREAPHTDIAQTIQFVCTKLISLIKTRKQVVPVYRKLPLILGGEQSVSLDEPVRSINIFMNSLEKDERIMSCSWHVGYLRHDCAVVGCGIVVVPSDACYQGYANQIANELASYVFNKRHEFHYTGLSVPPEKALEMAVEFKEKPVFITDSGDNVTSGAMGANTTVLRQFMNADLHGKKCLFASINDPNTFHMLEHVGIGKYVNISLGMHIDEETKEIPLHVEVKYHGTQVGTAMYGEEGNYGGLVRVTVINTSIDIVICDNNHSFVEEHQITACGVDWNDYDIIIVKQGYIHPELKNKGKLNIMSLTNGATLQDTKKLTFKLIMRPMYPIDNI